MKNYYKSLNLIIAVLFSGTLAVSCLDTDDQPNQNQSPKGSVALGNFSPGTSNLKFYSDGEPIFNNSVNYGQYHNTLWNGDVGIRQITVNSGSTVLDTLNLTIGMDRFYSVFAVNTANQTELVSYEENFIVPGPGKAAIHFYQLSSDAPNLKVAIAGETANLGTYLFKQSSNYMEINEVLNKRMFLIDNSTSDTLLSKFVTFNNGKNYSVVAKGLINTTDDTQKLDIQIIPYNL